MDPSLILRTSSVLLAITAGGGLVMAAIRFGGKPHPPSWLAMLHGFLAAAGLTLLVYAYFAMAIPAFAALALLLLLIAAAGGVLMNLGYHLKELPLRSGSCSSRAIGVVAFVLCSQWPLGGAMRPS